MGWAICAGIGAQLAKPDDLTIVLTGDGCMRMHGNELAVAARYQLPVVFIVINNSSYGSIEVRLSSQKKKEKLSQLPCIDWVGYANSMGLKGIRVESHAPAEVFKLILKRDGPLVIDLILEDCPQANYIAKMETCWPTPENLR
jgi:acetolactate synthase-1/2/3 large subunit